MAITYTTSGSAVFTESFSLDLYAGTPTTDEAWLKGGASAAYPGNLDGFLAANSEANPATTGIKLVCGQFTVGLANDETVELSGEASTVLAVIVGDNSTAAAGVTLKNITAGVAQFTVTGTSDAKVTCWMIVA